MTDRIASRFHSLALASLGLALMLTAAPAPARATESIKVGFMAPLSGIFAQAGKCSRASSWPSSRSAIRPPAARSS